MSVQAMSFHTPAKTLNPVDTALPVYVVKGAVIVDEGISEWNSVVSLDATAAMSTFIVIDKQVCSQPEELAKVVSRAASELKLPSGEQYSLAFEEPRLFLTTETIDRLTLGFMLTLTAAPCHFANRLKDVFMSATASCDHQKLEWAIGKLDQMSADACFVRAFFSSSNVDLLYDMVDNDRVNSSSTALSQLLHALSNIFNLSIDDINWSSAPPRIIQKLAILVTGRAKSEDSNTVLVALEMIARLVNSDSSSVRDAVLSEVPLHTLIRHLEKSDERVSLAALVLMNALHANSDEERRREIINHLSSKPFRAAVTVSVLREGRARDRALLDQLVPLQRLLINELTTMSRLEADKDVVDILLAKEEVSGHSQGVTVEEEIDALNGSGLGRLAVSTISRYVESNKDDLRILVSENAMRVGGGGWRLIPMFVQCLSIVAELLNVIPSDDDCVEPLIELLYNLDAPFESLFSTTVQLYHRTWREMQAAVGESEKVGKVVREQLRRTAARRPASVLAVEEELGNLPYWKMQELWKREQMERENDQLSSQTVNELRDLLRPSMEQLVRTNRKNFMKQGYTFKRQTKGKTPQKDQYWFWKLDPTEKVIHMIETDSDKYMEGTSHAGNSQKVNVKEISSVQWGEDGSATVRKGGGMLRGLRVTLHEGKVLSAAASADQALCTWVDGLNDLIGEKLLSGDANRIVDRLLNVELRLRLADVPQPMDPIVPPPLPTDFSWLPTVIEND